MESIGFSFLLLLLNSIGIIGFIQWIKVFVLSIVEKDNGNLWKSILTFVLSCLSGFISWKIGFKSYEWWISIPLSLGTLAITQLGYECIIKNLNIIIEGVMERIASIALERKS